MSTDTIAAIATGGGRTAIGILRLSGPGSIGAVDALFTPLGGAPFRERADRTLVYGDLRDRQGRLLDRCLATLSHGPNSYTGEDTCELQCHGSPILLAEGLEALFSLGVRQAEPGEFTKRAFLNGRLDLTQAEAVIDLIDAGSAAAARNAAGQLGGSVSRQADEVYDRLADLSAHFDAVLDYADEDLEPFTIAELSETVRACSDTLDRLLSTVQRGRQLKEGIPTAIIGAPNAGKSSLLNALVGYDRAIVTDIPGTTRDTLEETVTLGGALLRLIDTAGLRETQDTVEQLGVRRSREALENAGLLLVTVDGSRPLSEESRAVLASVDGRENTVLLLTKSDLGLSEDCRGLLAAYPDAIPLCAPRGDGLALLEERVRRLFPEPSAAEEGSLLTNLRQADAVRRANEALLRLREGLELGLTPDMLLTDSEEAMSALGELTGRTVTEDITARIFERFCVGK